MEEVSPSPNPSGQDDPCTHLTQGVKGDKPMACMFAVNIFPPPCLIGFKRRWIKSHRFPGWSYHGEFANG